MLTHRQRFNTYVAQTSASPMGLDISYADGVYLYSAEGKRYLDLISGIAVSSLGHGNREVIAAVKDQLDKHMHLMVFGEYIQAVQVQLAMQLCEILPAGLDNVYFTNSGAEAIEGAMKLAKRYTGRPEIVSFSNAYHGHTQGALSVMGNEEWKRSFRPLLPDIKILQFNQTDDVRHITLKTACVLIEPVQGEAGVITPYPGFLEAIRHRCTETGALLIFDEVQTGMGRTGSLFALEKYGVIPDVLVLAKALGCGMPLGAFIASREKMSCLTHDPPLGHITTFGGHPVSCAAALAGLKILLREKYWEEAEGKAAVFHEKLGKHPAVKEIRHAGLLMAIELEHEDQVQQVIHGCLEKGVITDWFLFRPTAIRIAPPLTISREELLMATGVISQELDKL